MPQLEHFRPDLKKCSSGNDQEIFGALFQQTFGGGKIFLVNDLSRWRGVMQAFFLNANQLLLLAGAHPTVVETRANPPSEEKEHEQEKTNEYWRRQTTLEQVGRGVSQLLNIG